MIDVLIRANNKADIAVIGFKTLITISCMSFFIVLGRMVLEGNWYGFDSWLFLCNTIVVIAYLLAGIFFMVWFYAVYKDMYKEFPAALGYRPIWTVLGFSFPVVNVFLPYVLVVNTWRQLVVIHAGCANDTVMANSAEPHYFKFWWLFHLMIFMVIPTVYWFVLAGGEGEILAMGRVVLSLFAYVMVCNTARYAIRLVREFGSVP